MLVFFFESYFIFSLPSSVNKLYPPKNHFIVFSASFLIYFTSLLYTCIFNISIREITKFCLAILCKVLHFIPFGFIFHTSFTKEEAQPKLAVLLFDYLFFLRGKERAVLSISAPQW